MELFKAACDPACSFAVQSHDKHEIAEIVKRHAKEVHKMALSDAKAKEYIKAA